MSQGILYRFIAVVLCLHAPAAMARDYYVSSAAAPGGDGSRGAPFQSIQAAANKMKAGDTCIIGTGTYRETVRPAGSGTAGAPITFCALPEDSAVVSGCDVVTGWSHFDGDIHRAPIDWTLEIGCNQVFVDGSMLLEARFPNGTTDLLKPVLTPATTLANQKVTFAGLDQPADAWKGAIYWGRHAPNWAVTAGRISASSPGGVTCSDNIGFWWFDGAGEGCVIGALAGLDSESEFFNDGTHLYLCAPPGTDLASKKIEAKRRLRAFDCSSRSHIVIRNLHIRAATVDFANARNCVLEECSVLYPVMASAAGQLYSAWSPDCNGGIFLSGNGNTVRRCLVAYSAHCGIVLDGTEQTVENCVVHDVNWVGGYQAAVQLTGGEGHRIVRNTLYNTGRSVIDLRGATNINVDILYNHLYNYGLLTDDLGVIYAYKCDGNGSNIAYNWVHDNLSHGLRIGIYLDNVSGNFRVYRNVVWNCPGDAGIRVNLPAYNHEIYNNTLFNTLQVGSNSYDDGSPCPDGETCTWRQGNNYLSRKPADDFMDRANYDFRPRPGSPLIDKGKIFSPYTDGYVGTAPDLGAYESGGDMWRAGHEWSPVTKVDRRPRPAADFRLGVSYPNPFNASTMIPYHVGRRSRVRLDVCDVLGRRIATLIDRTIGQGGSSVTWNGTDDDGAPVSSGVYFFVLNTDGRTASRKALLIR